MRKFSLIIMLMALICAYCASLSVAWEFEYGLHDSVKALPPKEELPKDLSPELRALVEKLYDSNLKVRQDAVSAIGGMKEKAAPAIPILLIVLNDNDWQTRKRVITTFEEINDPSLISLLRYVYDNEKNPPVKRAARLAVVKIKKSHKIAPYDK